jgi:hypothetical protein
MPTNSFKDDVIMIEDRISAEAWLKAVTCTWKMTGNTWQTGCGHSICDDSTSHDWVFCPWCGKGILEVDDADKETA